MFDEDTYFSFKLFELLLTEPHLKEWIEENPILSTSDCLTCFLTFLGPFLENNYLSPQMKNNALNYINLVRFNDDEEVEKIDYISKQAKIELINNIIRLINSQNSTDYIIYYRQELFKRTTNKKCLTTYNDSIILKCEQQLLDSIRFDHFVLMSHSDQVPDEMFKQEFLPILISDLRYFQTINCILDEYPNQFKNPIFDKRYKIVIRNFLNKQDNVLGYKEILSYNDKVNNKLMNYNKIKKKKRIL